MDAACAPYRQAGQFAWRFARGKLSADPAFRHILESGLIPSNARVLDLGCGQGLLASLLVAVGEMRGRGEWAEQWCEAPVGTRVHGIELMEADVRRAQQALGARATFTQGDISKEAFAPTEVVVLLDVLHYIGYADQQRVLESVRAALGASGVLLLRVGDAAGGLPFRISNWVDHVVTFARGHRLSRLYCRTLDEWTGLLTGFGFVVEKRPMSRGTPFANVLLVGRLQKHKNGTDFLPSPFGPCS